MNTYATKNTTNRLVGYAGQCGVRPNRAISRAKKKVSSVDDGELMFKIANHLVNSTDDKKTELLEIFDGIMKRYERKTGEEESDVKVPRNKKEAKDYFLGGDHGVLNALPSENFFR